MFSISHSLLCFHAVQYSVLHTDIFLNAIAEESETIKIRLLLWQPVFIIRIIRVQRPTRSVSN